MEQIMSIVKHIKIISIAIIFLYCFSLPIKAATEIITDHIDYDINQQFNNDDGYAYINSEVSVLQNIDIEFIKLVNGYHANLDIIESTVNLLSNSSLTSNYNTLNITKSSINMSTGSDITINGPDGEGINLGAEYPIGVDQPVTDSKITVANGAHASIDSRYYMTIYRSGVLEVGDGATLDLTVDTPEPGIDGSHGIFHMGRFFGGVYVYWT
jgi:hypothetical protein